jgi:hypothetical protein
MPTVVCQPQFQSVNPCARFFDNRSSLGGGLLYTIYKDNIRTALRTLYPHHEWLDWKFSSVARGFWSSTDNQRAFLAWVGNQLGFKDLSGWYSVTNIQVIELGGSL